METGAETPAPTTSLVARMCNVFATPSEVFDEVKQSKPSTGNWLAPALLAMVTGIVFVLILFSQPAMIQQIRDQTARAMEAQVKAGKLTQAQADQSVDQTVGFGLMAAKIGGFIVAALLAFLRIFWWALVLWLMGKWFLKASFSYQQALEVVGLATVIAILGAIIATLLSVYLGKTASVSLALFVPNSSPTSLLHAGLALVDLFDLWLTCVMAVGLSRLAGAPWSKALALTFGYWLVMAAILFSFALLGAHFSAGAK
jgi:hypothetical protein